MLQVYGLQVLNSELQQQHQRRNMLLPHKCLNIIYNLGSLYRLHVNS